MSKQHDTDKGSKVRDEGSALRGVIGTVLLAVAGCSFAVWALGAPVLIVLDRDASVPPLFGQAWAFALLFGALGLALLVDLRFAGRISRLIGFRLRSRHHRERAEASRRLDQTTPRTPEPPHREPQPAKNHRRKSRTRRRSRGTERAPARGETRQGQIVAVLPARDGDRTGGPWPAPPSVAPTVRCSPGASELLRPPHRSGSCRRADHLRLAPTLGLLSRHQESCSSTSMRPRPRRAPGIHDQGVNRDDTRTT